jgi:glutaminyl-tRNA synthetase
MAVLDPLKVVLTNWPEGVVEELEAVNNPEDASAGTRKVAFGRELWIESDDFREVPPPKYHRLSPGQEVRLRWGFIVRCEEVVKDAAGGIVELRCTYDPTTRSGGEGAARKVKGTIHWVSSAHAVPAEVRLYDRLFTKELPDDAPEGQDWLSNLNPDSLLVRKAFVEPALAAAAPGAFLQFERLGYFSADPDSRPGRPVFNRSVGLRDTWAKIEKKGRGA